MKKQYIVASIVVLITIVACVYFIVLKNKKDVIPNESTTKDVKDTIYWVYAELPPFVYLKNNEIVKGSAYEIENILRKKLPEYNHTRVKTNVKRAIRSITGNQGWVCSFLFKNPEREKTLVFSYPSIVVSPRYIVIRKIDEAKFGNKSELSLTDLLKNKKLLIGINTARSYGKVLDKILKGPIDSKQKNVIKSYSASLGKELINMLFSRQIDYAIGYSYEFADAMKKNENIEKIKLITIKESSGFGVARIAAAKNKWGKDFINKINKVLCKAVRTEEYYNTMTKYVDTSLVKDFRQIYDKIVVAPTEGCQ